MDLPQLQWHWDAFGRSDPLWAVLTDPERRGNRWSPAEFFETGRGEVAGMFERAAAWDLPRQRRRALDFGCGVGRLTQALASYVDEAVGVDIAPSMIQLARRYNSCGARCTYEVNDAPELERFSDHQFDIIYTTRVLQHIEPRYSERYIGELARVLAPGGYLEFDVPSEAGFFPISPTHQTRSALAYRAALMVLSAPTTLRPSGTGLVRVEVTNTGTETWRDVDLNLGNHWIRTDGATVLRDDARAAIPLPWHPGESRTLELHVTAPDDPGIYRMQCDVVEEHVTWFAEAGSSATDVQIAVGATDSLEATALIAREVSIPTESVRGDTAIEEPAPQMEMHAVPRATVGRILATAGAQLLAVVRVHHCGPTWLTYRYAVTR